MGILFRMHNWTSCKLILKELVMTGLTKHVEGEEEEVISLGDEVMERLTIGQLFSECCNLCMARGQWIYVFLFQA